MNLPYTLIEDLLQYSQPPADGTLSSTLFQDDRLKVILFQFSAGQELSEHTSSMSAIMHFLAGKADVTLGAERAAVGPGAWIHMPPHLPHSVKTTTPVTMLLLLLK